MTTVYIQSEILGVCVRCINYLPSLERLCALANQVFSAAYGLGNKVCGNDPVFITLTLTTAVVALLVEEAQSAAFVFLGTMLLGGIFTIWDARRPSRAKAYRKVRPE